MTCFSYDIAPLDAPRLGLIVLQSDETIEQDMRQLLGNHAPYVTRVPSEEAVSPESLQTMEAHIESTARLLPQAQGFAAVGYGCTSGTAQIGEARIADLTKAGCATKHVSNPLTALVAACATLGIQRLAFLSPYVGSVSDRLRKTLKEQGIETPVFGSFDEAEEAKVVRIAATSIKTAARALCEGRDVDGVFLSCTNLRTLNVIDGLEAEIGLPVLSSNQVLAWHLAQLAGVPVSGPGRLLA